MSHCLGLFVVVVVVVVVAAAAAVVVVAVVDLDHFDVLASPFVGTAVDSAEFVEVAEFALVETAQKFVD